MESVVTYYEHFGLTREATQDEIHKAYRSLCRLLHPDHQTRGDLQALAEAQMRWVNQVYHTLRDPDRRREYDRTLEAAPQEVPAGLPQVDRWVNLSGRWKGTVLWYGLSALVAGGLAWMLSGHRIADRRVEGARDAEPAGAIPARGRIAVRSPSSASIAREPSRPAVATRPGSPVLPSQPLQAPLALLPPPVMAPDPLPANPVFGSTEWLAVPRRFQGTWSYLVPSRTEAPRPAALYAPEFIETAIVEAGATIEGRYRARYVIPDRAISPNVAFHFSGVVTGDEARLVWTGSGGAKGEGRLRLLSGSSIEISWAATQMGSDLGLAAGRAVLVRQANE